MFLFINIDANYSIFKIIFMFAKQFFFFFLFPHRAGVYEPNVHENKWSFCSKVYAAV